MCDGIDSKKDEELLYSDMLNNNIEIIEMFVDTFGFILKAGDITMVKMNADDCSLKQSFDIGKRIDLQYNPDFRSWRK